MENKQESTVTIRGFDEIYTALPNYLDRSGLAPRSKSSEKVPNGLSVIPAAALNQSTLRFKTISLQKYGFHIISRHFT